MQARWRRGGHLGRGHLAVAGHRPGLRPGRRRHADRPGTCRPAPLGVARSVALRAGALIRAGMISSGWAACLALASGIPVTRRGVPADLPRPAWAGPARLAVLGARRRVGRGVARQAAGSGPAHAARPRRPRRCSVGALVVDYPTAAAYCLPGAADRADRRRQCWHLLEAARPRASSRPCSRTSGRICVSGMTFVLLLRLAALRRALSPNPPPVRMLTGRWRCSSRCSSRRTTRCGPACRAS